MSTSSSSEESMTIRRYLVDLVSRVLALVASWRTELFCMRRLWTASAEPPGWGWTAPAEPPGWGWTAPAEPPGWGERDLSLSAAGWDAACLATKLLFCDRGGWPLPLRPVLVKTPRGSPLRFGRSTGFGASRTGSFKEAVPLPAPLGTPAPPRTPRRPLPAAAMRSAKDRAWEKEANLK